MTLRASNRNETQEDLAKEREVASLVATAWGCELKKLTEDRLHLADYAAVSDGDVRAFIEIRCRLCSSSTFPDVFIPLHKVLWAQSVHTLLGIPYFYVVRFEGDGVVAYRSITGGSPCRYRASWTERKTEPETHPDGPVLSISSSDFKVLARRRREPPPLNDF